MAETYSPLQKWQFDSTSNRIGFNHTLGTDQNQYERGTANLGYKWDRSNALQQYARQRDRMPSGFTRRGLMGNSGMWGRAITDFETDKVNTLSRLAQANQQKMAGFTLSQQQLDRIRKQAYDDLDAQKAAVRAEKLLSLGS